jgi:hypothetical protein
MSGLMRRFSRGRATTDDEATPPATGTSEAAGDAATDAPQPGGPPLSGDAATAMTAGEPATAAPAAETTAPAPADATAQEPPPGRDLPAGIDLDELAAAPAPSARRGRLRRRLHYLRHVRELLLRDLGGFYAEAHRSERGPDAHRRLLDIKARRLATLDAEVRELEAELSEPHAETVLREPGIGGTCPECGELYGSDARFCSRCGAPLRGRAARARAGTTGAGTPAPATDEGERMTTASLWGRRRTPAQEPAEPTRAGDLTQPVDPSDEPTTAGKPGEGSGEPTGGASNGANTRPAAAGDEQPAGAREEPRP